MSLKVIFAGTPDFAVPALQALIDSDHEVVAVYTQPDRHAGRGQHLVESPVKQLAKQHHITVCQPKTLRDDDAQKELSQWQADIMVVAAYGLILPQVVLDAPRLGCINIHGSLLPRWRGAAPIQRAILAGDQETGITMMQMDKGLDTGEMICSETCAINEDDTAQSLHDKLAPLGAKLMLDALTQLENGTATLSKQNNDDATYADKITKAEGRIDWQQSALKIAHHVRAFNPWPVAFTQFNDHVIRVWKSEVVDAGLNAAPGAVVDASHDGIDVATGEGVLRLLVLQAPGGKALPIREFYNAKQDWFVKNKTVLR